MLYEVITDAGYYAGILHQSTDACFAVMAQMSRRLHWQVAELDRLTLHNAASRVVRYLLDQVPSTHLVTSEFQLDTPKHVIASRLSITPETLSRTVITSYSIHYTKLYDAGGRRRRYRRQVQGNIRARRSTADRAPRCLRTERQGFR